MLHRLVLWNIDLTLLDVTKVARAAYAEAFAAVTGRPLVQLPQMVGKTEPEIFFDALGRNGVSLRADGESERLLAPFGAEFATRLAARRDQLTAQGTLLPGAAEALRPWPGLGGVVQSVLTGSSRPNAALKLRAFGLDRYLDLGIGGFAGSEPYPKGALLRATRLRAEEKYKVSFAEKADGLHRGLPARRRGGEDRRRDVGRGGKRPGVQRRAPRRRRGPGPPRPHQTPRPSIALISARG